MRSASALAFVLLFFSGCLASPEPQPSDAAAMPNPFLVLNTRVLVQFDHVSGLEPTEQAVNALDQVMREVGLEPRFIIRPSLNASDGNYTAAEVIAIHRETYLGAYNWTANGEAVLHVLNLEGHAAEDVNWTVIHGWAFSRAGLPLISLFPETLPTTSLFKVHVGIPGQNRGGFERSTLVHEFGHVLGLVGCHLPELRARQDPASECHSTHSGSVMAASIHASDDAKTWALDDEMQPVWRFDSDDWADIRAYQASLQAASALPSSS